MVADDAGSHPYVRAWRRFDAFRRPYLLSGDESLTRSSTAFTSFAGAVEYEAAQVGPDDARFHLGLLPQPFHGPVEDADAYVLMLNPGFDPRDYHWDSMEPEFRTALVNQYQGTSSFLFLDERFRAHPGHRWWWAQAQLGRIAMALAEGTGSSMDEATRQLARRVAAIELMAYHSKSFDRGFLDGAALPSVQLARAFVREYVLPRARSGRSVLIVARGNWAWGLDEEPNVVVYRGTEPVAARIGPGTRGGDLLLRHLGVAGKSSGSTGPASRPTAPSKNPDQVTTQPPRRPPTPSSDLSDPALTVRVLDELVARFHMNDVRFRRLHHAKAYEVTVAAHRAYCTTDPKRPARFRAGGANATTAARLIACLDGLREGKGWEKAVSAALARLPR